MATWIDSYWISLHHEVIERRNQCVLYWQQTGFVLTWHAFELIIFLQSIVHHVIPNNFRDFEWVGWCSPSSIICPVITWIDRYIKKCCRDHLIDSVFATQAHDRQRELLLPKTKHLSREQIPNSSVQATLCGYPVDGQPLAGRNRFSWLYQIGLWRITANKDSSTLKREGTIQSTVTSDTKVGVYESM